MILMSTKRMARLAGKMEKVFQGEGEVRVYFLPDFIYFEADDMPCYVLAENNFFEEHPSDVLEDHDIRDIVHLTVTRGMLRDAAELMQRSISEIYSTSLYCFITLEKEYTMFEFETGYMKLYDNGEPDYGYGSLVERRDGNVRYKAEWCLKHGYPAIAFVLFNRALQMELAMDNRTHVVKSLINGLGDSAACCKRERFGTWYEHEMRGLHRGR